jgi:hypothetical protein
MEWALYFLDDDGLILSFLVGLARGVTCPRVNSDDATRILMVPSQFQAGWFQRLG